MFQVKFAVGSNSKKFLSNRQTKISDTLKERRFHLDLGARAPLEWQWTYISIPRENSIIYRTPMFFFFFSKYSSFVSVERRGKASLFITRRTISRTPRNNALFEAKLVEAVIFFFFFYDAITVTSNSIDPSTALFSSPSLQQTNFQRSVAKKM